MTGVFLTLNAGSSSLKFAVFDSDTQSDAPLIRGKIAGIGGRPMFSARDANGAALHPLTLPNEPFDHEAMMALLLPWLGTHHGERAILGVGHRVVHGGQYHTRPTVITDAVLQQLETLAPLAPLHQPHNIAAIRAVAKWQPHVAQVACFDTSFHRTQDRLAQLFALPRNLTDDGIIRYGFHGLSYDYIASVLPTHLGDQASGRVIVAHLGNGASICSMRDRQSVATSMGFTALDGLMMGRRCGALDPGVVMHLIREKGMTAPEVENLLYKQSGLLGVSGLSNDMQILQDSRDPYAAEAIALFCDRAASSLAGLVPSIGGLDALVFTAGIGENSALVRRLICQKLEWLGLFLDGPANDRDATTVSAEPSRVQVLVIPTNEEAVVARACRSLLV